MQMIAHRLDTFKKGYHLDTKEGDVGDGNYRLLMVQLDGGHIISKWG